MLMQLLFTWLMILCCIFLQLGEKIIVDTQQSTPFIDCFFNFYCPNESSYSKISCANTSSFRENDAKKHSRKSNIVWPWQLSHEVYRAHLSLFTDRKTVYIIATRRFSISEAKNMDLFFEFKRWMSNLVRFAQRVSLCVFFVDVFFLSIRSK